MHVALRVAYDGTLFRGLARQPHGNTVEDALIAGLRSEGYVEGTLRCGSRTDAGVSAAENVLSVELERPHLQGLIPAVQAGLPEGVWLTGAAPMPEAWRPRQAVARTYQYLANRQGESLDALQSACAAFIGEHNFAGFARMEDRPAVRPLTSMTVAESGAFWQYEVTAPGFLWNQVRRMVDACLVVGQGKATVAQITASLASGMPDAAFQLAPPEGLLLTSVHYAPDIAWDPAAGVVHPGKLARAQQAAQVRWQLAQALSESS